MEILPNSIQVITKLLLYKDAKSSYGDYHRTCRIPYFDPRSARQSTLGVFIIHYVVSVVPYCFYFQSQRFT